MKLRLEDRRSDILAARDAWKKEYDAAKDLYQSQEDEYNAARLDSEMFLEDQVKTLIGKTFLNLRINASMYGSSWGSKSYSVEVQQDERDSALRWNWKVYLDDDGEVKKDSGSWSGLQAVTDDDMAQLEESVRILKKLNNADWKTILSKMEAIRPSYKDFITAKDPDYEKRPDFEAQLKQVAVEDAIGEKVLVKGKGNETGGRDGSYYIIHKQTPKQTSVTEIAKYYVDKIPEGEDVWDYVNKYGIDYRISTDKFLKFIDNDPEIMDLR